MNGMVVMDTVGSPRATAGVWLCRLGVLFGVWLFLSVSAPDEVYRTFFHGLIYPLVAYLALKRRDVVELKDPFLAVFVLFCAYMSVSTWFVGSGPVEDDWQASRWGMEAAWGMLAFKFWMSSINLYRKEWGRVFLGAALVGSLAGLATAPLPEFGSQRTSGLGMLEHPIQGASIVTLLLTVGLFISLHGNKSKKPTDVVLAVFAIVLTCLFVVMTKSRAPILAISAYLVFLAMVMVMGTRFRRYLTALGIILLACFIVFVVYSQVGGESLIDQLVRRGDSHRFDIWTAYLSYPPESLWFGNGAGMNFELMEASRQYLEPLGLYISHPHNIWLGVWAETGFIGIGFQLILLGLPVFGVVKAPIGVTEKLHLIALLSLFVMLTFTDEYTLLRSLHPVWLIGWLPLIFAWSWAHSARTERKKRDKRGRACV